MNTSMIVYRLFDVADEIDLDLVQALWTSRNKIASSSAWTVYLPSLLLLRTRRFLLSLVPMI